MTWVDASSTPFFLFYHGGVEDGVPALYQTEMYHESNIKAQQGNSGYVCPRIRFEPTDDGNLVYLWELSTDQGATWKLEDRVLFRRR